jgi:hypothetical protein
MEERRLSLVTLRGTAPGEDGHRMAWAAWWDHQLRGFPPPFQRACQASLQDPEEAVDPGDWEPLLAHLDLLDEGEGAERGRRREEAERLLRLHLEVTALLQRRGRWTTAEVPPELEGPLREAAARWGFPRAFVRDLARFLSGMEDLPAEARVRQRVVLIDRSRPSPQARLAVLVLERVDDEEETLYPHPRQAFLGEDGAFREAREAARAYVREREGVWARGRGGAVGPGGPAGGDPAAGGALPGGLLRRRPAVPLSRPRGALRGRPRAIHERGIHSGRSGFRRDLLRRRRGKARD